MKKGWLQTVLIGNAAVILLSFLLYQLDTLQVLRNALFDYNTQWTMSQEPHEDIVVVGIDDASLKEIGTFPFDRKVYISVIDTMEKAGAKVIAFDITFSTESNPASDQALAETLAKYKNIIIPSYAVTEDEFNRSTRGSKDDMIMARSLEKPIPAIAKVTQTGHINRSIDSDGVIRRTWLQLNTPEGPIDSLAFKAAKMAGYDVNHYLNYSPQKEIFIRFDAKSKDFNYVSMGKVLRGEVPASFFKDRVVFVGYTGAGNDEGTTPIETHMNLVYAHANITSQLLNDKAVFPAVDKVSLLLMAAMMLLVGLAAWRLRSTFSVLLFFVLILILFTGQFFIFSATGQVVDVIYPTLAALISFLVNLAMKTYFETKQKNYITKQFGRYISPDLVKEIARHGQEIQLGGINRDLSILFLDIRGFTPLSEKLTPEEIVDFLNMMFNLITEQTLQNKGTIDKFIGDAAMLLFNAPLDVPYHEYRAVKTAYDIQQGMIQVREDIKKKHHVNIAVGIGVNSGNVVVGNIGSYLRVDYTAIGDNVNTAARIESNTEPNQILVSEATYERTKDYFEYNYIGEKQVKGKSVPLRLYEVTGHKQAPQDLKQP
ncbi:CHASE2 domain-containing protein [Paenibacillus sp. y28]|uniref:CHASE2 domain-containing protein n=1 Tax=Paenibacillus sp. y28 TaxID=3129110 RepID=UPI00301714E5